MMKRSRHSSRGQSMIETMVAVAILSTLTASMFAFSVASRPGEASATANVFRQAVELAHAKAVASGGVATVMLYPPTSNKANGHIDVFADVPTASESAAYSAPYPSATLTASGPNGLNATSAIAIFVDAEGRSGVMNWNPTSGPLAQMPSCNSNNTPLTLTFGTTSNPITLQNCGVQATQVQYGNNLRS